MPGGQLHAFGVGGEVTEDADGVEAVQLRHPHHVDARRLEVLRSSGGLPRVTRVRDAGRELHGFMLARLGGMRHDPSADGERDG